MDLSVNFVIPGLQLFELVQTNSQYKSGTVRYKTVKANEY